MSIEILWDKIPARRQWHGIFKNEKNKRKKKVKNLSIQNYIPSENIFQNEREINIFKQTTAETWIMRNVKESSSGRRSVIPERNLNLFRKWGWGKWKKIWLYLKCNASYDEIWLNSIKDNCLKQDSNNIYWGL